MTYSKTKDDDFLFDKLYERIKNDPKAEALILDWAMEEVQEFAIKRDLPIEKAVEMWINEKVAEYEMDRNTKQ